jgi:hypothetical protein
MGNSWPALLRFSIELGQTIAGLTIVGDKM